MSKIVSVTPLALERDSRAFKQAVSLARLGYESVVVESRASDLDRATLPFELISLGPSADDPSRAERPPRSSGPALVRAVRRAVEPVIALAASLRWNLRTLRALPRASLYILHSYDQFPAVYLRSRRTGAPYVYDARDSYWEGDASRDPRFRARTTRRIFERLERACARRSVRVTTVSDGVAGLLERRFARRPLVIRNAADPRLDRPSPRNVRDAAGVGEEDFLLVMAGNAKPGDTIEEALEALALLPGGVHLALVGSGHDRFAARARERGLEHRVHVLPPVPPTEVASFIATADAAPILYRAWTVNFVYALPNRFYHAVAAGLPLLYPPLEEITAICEEHELGLPIDPTDPESIADGVRRLVEDPELVARLRHSVERARGVLSWEREERVLAELVREELSAAETGGGR